MDLVASGSTTPVRSPQAAHDIFSLTRTVASSSTLAASPRRDSPSPPKKRRVEELGGKLAVFRTPTRGPSSAPSSPIVPLKSWTAQKPDPSDPEAVRHIKRKQALYTFVDRWDDIIHRYSSPAALSSNSPGHRGAIPVDEDDIIDLDTLEVVVDRGVLSGTKPGANAIGTFMSADRGGREAEIWEPSKQDRVPWEDGRADPDEPDLMGVWGAQEAPPSRSFRELRRRMGEDNVERDDFLEQNARLYGATPAPEDVDEDGSDGDDGVDARRRREMTWVAGNELLARGEEDESEEDELALEAVPSPVLHKYARRRSTGSTVLPSSSSLSSSLGSESPIKRAQTPGSTTKGMRDSVRDLLLNDETSHGFAAVRHTKQASSSPLRRLAHPKYRSSPNLSSLTSPDDRPSVAAAHTFALVVPKHRRRLPDTRLPSPELFAPPSTSHKCAGVDAAEQDDSSIPIGLSTPPKSRRRRFGSPPSKNATMDVSFPDGSTSRVLSSCDTHPRRSVRAASAFPASGGRLFPPPQVMRSSSVAPFTSLPITRPRARPPIMIGGPESDDEDPLILGADAQASTRSRIPASLAQIAVPRDGQDADISEDELGLW